MNKKTKLAHKAAVDIKAEVSVHELFKIKKKSKSHYGGKGKGVVCQLHCTQSTHTTINFLHNLLINILSRIYNALN